MHLLAGVNSDSGNDLSKVLPATEGVPPGALVDSSHLYNVLAECRVIKSPDEIELMR